MSFSNIEESILEEDLRILAAANTANTDDEPEDSISHSYSYSYSTNNDVSISSTSRLSSSGRHGNPHSPKAMRTSSPKQHRPLGNATSSVATNTTANLPSPHSTTSSNSNQSPPQSPHVNRNVYKSK